MYGTYTTAQQYYELYKESTLFFKYVLIKFVNVVNTKQNMPEI